MVNEDKNWGGGTWEGTLDWPLSNTSRVYDLAVRYENGMTHHAAHRPYSFELVTKHGDHAYPGGISSAMEFITLGAHVGTHVDAPGHISLDGCVSNGRDIMSQQDARTGVGVGSVEELPPLYGPAHLVDGEKIFGREMTPKDGFGAEELEEWFATRATPAKDSIVLFRTGWMKFWEDSDRYLGREAGLPGVKLSGAKWLSDRGVRAVGADSVNFEHKPELTVPSLSVHVHLLVEKGIPIMESLNLEQLAADEVYEFFFAASPLRIGGGTGAPIRPLAFVAL
ncbi:cyclase family protein [Arthrobacter sp. CC3]|uniref:cyclase family protein n=1 Tax=Arthrobacter sp. CC3 TaxID=3029185 RepID=UPI003265C3A5